jgi:hypothetical protein
MQITITDKEYEELMRIKRQNEKLVELFTYDLNKLKEEIEYIKTTINPGDSISGYYLTRKARLEKKIADLEELLK